ncbi:MAG: alpha/beta hydrolase family protein [Armatimonadota bacterium]
MSCPLHALLPVAWAVVAADPAPLPQVPGIVLTEVELPSSLDGVAQPVIVGVPESYDGSRPTPLLVGLHTWSAGYQQRAEPYGAEAARRGWLLVLPHFRGPNTTANPSPTQAGGSLPAQHDIADARRYMLEHYEVDPTRVYITGDSGGGHMTLLMAAKYPDLWTAAAAWVPVTDLREWWELQSGYAAHIEAVTGGKPGESAAIDFEYLRRSPRTFMSNLAHLPVLLAHGDRDASIPVEQSWRTFRALDAVPRHRTVFYVFSGGHTSDHRFGFDWLSQHVGSGEPPTELHLVTDESKAYYWADLKVADDTALGRADIVLDGDALAIATSNLSSVTIDLRDLPLPEGGIFLSVRSDLPLELRLRNAPAEAELAHPVAWTTFVEADGLSIFFSAPSEEARSLRLAW